MLRIYPLVAVLIALNSSPSFAETQAERDAQRSSYIEGYKCNGLSQGQDMTMRFKRGYGELRVGEAEVNFRWSIKEDVLCFQYDGQKKGCSTLPARRYSDEKEALRKMLSPSCF